MQTYTLRADVASAQSDGVTTTAGGADIIVGGEAPNSHALLRFAMDDIDAAEVLVQAMISAKVSALGAGTVPDIYLWASDFGAAIANADYGLAAANPEMDESIGYASDYRVQISNSASPFIDGESAVVGDVPEVLVPTRFIRKGVGLFSDFELRPGTATVGATDTITFHGAGAVTPADKPTLEIITLTQAELVSRNPFRWQAIGAESFFAFGREGNEGEAVKACNILDADNVSLGLTPTNLRGNGLSSNRVKPRKSAVGATEAGGAVSFDLTPEKCMQLLPGVLKLTGTVTDAGVYTHTFKVAKSNEIASFTMVTKKGAFRYVYPGAKISRFSLTLTLDSLVKGSIDVMALTEWSYDYTSAGLDDEHILDPAAAYDTIANGLWSFVDGSVSVGDQDGECIQAFTVTFTNDVRAKRGLTKKRGPNSHYPLGFEVSANLSMYFENEAVIKRIMGTQAVGFPWKPGKIITFDAIEMDLSRDDIPHTFNIQLPKANFITKSDPINGEDAIMIDVQTEANYDEASASNVVVTLTTLEPASAFEPSSNLITVKPAGE